MQLEGFRTASKKDATRLQEEGRWNYPLAIPWDGILVDDSGHPLDLETCIHQVLQVIWKDRWEAIEHEACEILGVHTLRMQTSRSKEEEKTLDRLLDFEQELKDFRDELLRVAQFWKPNLNDGVQITAAPLWKLFQYKPWQKTLKDTWEKLEKGDYDWAHLAYSIWPDRIRAKCRHDKSLAIAHGLEELYEAPQEQPKKKRGRTRG